MQISDLLFGLIPNYRNGELVLCISSYGVVTLFYTVHEYYNICTKDSVGRGRGALASALDL